MLWLTLFPAGICIIDGSAAGALNFATLLIRYSLSSMTWLKIVTVSITVFWSIRYCRRRSPHSNADDVRGYPAWRYQWASQPRVSTRPWLDRGGAQSCLSLFANQSKTHGYYEWMLRSRLVCGNNIYIPIGWVMNCMKMLDTADLRLREGNVVHFSVVASNFKKTLLPLIGLFPKT